MNNEQKGSDLQNKQKGNHTSQKSKLVDAQTNLK
jgi:hypothetical protein